MLFKRLVCLVHFPLCVCVCVCMYVCVCVLPSRLLFAVYSVAPSEVVDPLIYSGFVEELVEILEVKKQLMVSHNQGSRGGGGPQSWGQGVEGGHKSGKSRAQRRGSHKSKGKLHMYFVFLSVCTNLVLFCAQEIKAAVLRTLTAIIHFEKDPRYGADRSRLTWCLCSAGPTGSV